MDAALSLAIAEYAPPPIGPDPRNGRREHICPACKINLFERAHDLSCVLRTPPLVVFLALDREGHRAEVELLRCTEKALYRWLESGRSTAYEQGRSS